MDKEIELKIGQTVYITDYWCGDRVCQYLRKITIRTSKVNEIIRHTEINKKGTFEDIRYYAIMKNTPSDYTKQTECSIGDDTFLTEKEAIAKKIEMEKEDKIEAKKDAKDRVEEIKKELAKYERILTKINNFNS